MPHGTPDWGLVGPKATTFGLDDWGEHAVRLGSPHFFDRRGDCLLLTDFRVGLEGLVGLGDGIGWAVDLFTGASRTGAYAVRLTTIGGDGNKAGLLANLAYPVISLLGLEFTFAGDGTRRWIGYLDWYTGARQYMARIRISEATGLMEYSTGALTWATQATLGALISNAQAIHTLKFVVDIAMPTPEFVRAILNANLEQLTNIPVPWVVDAATLPHLAIHVYIENNAGTEAVGYVDNVIVTQNEPPFQE